MKKVIKFVALGVVLLAAAAMGYRLVGAETNVAVKVREEAAQATAGEQEKAKEPEKYPLLQQNEQQPSRRSSAPWWSWDDRDVWDPFAEDWDPFEEIRRMHKNLNRILSESARRFDFMPRMPRGGTMPDAFAPDADLTEDDTHFIVKMDLPGVDRSKLNVEIEGRMLTVSGVTESEKKETEGGGRIMRLERRRGSFYRSIMLPAPVKAEGAEAVYENGVLTVRIPKEKPGPGKTPIKVKSGTTQI